MRSAWIALVICGLAAALEGAWAGGGVKERFAALKMPRRAPSLGLWITIGVAYYVIYFIVLTRVLNLASSPARTFALTLIWAVLLMNGFWNLLFFRRRDLRLSFLAGLLYSVTAVWLFVAVDASGFDGGGVAVPVRGVPALCECVWLRGLEGESDRVSSGRKLAVIAEC